MKRNLPLIARLIPPSRNLGYKDFYMDFLAGKNPPKNFYPAQNPEKVAGEIERVDYNREALAAILKKQNILYGAGQQTLTEIERLKDPRAVCVFAGQQAGLLGGPLLTVVKMLGIVKAARRYEKRLQRPVIPVFWIAGDDHDFEEVNNLFLLDRQSRPCEIAYKARPETALPAAEIYFSDRGELESVINQIRTCLGDSEYISALFDLIRRSYTPEDTLVTAFGKFMSVLMKDFCLVLFNPGDREVKQLARPFFENVLNQQSEIQNLIKVTNEKILKAGYHLQVEKKENATHLFYNKNGRQPVFCYGNDYIHGKNTVSRSELLEELLSFPEKFSTDVLTRPVLQSYLFPTLVQLGGPSEIAYFAQMNPLFGLFDVPAPCQQARPTVTILEKRFEDLMETHEISFMDLTGDIEQVVNRILTGSFPEDIEKKMGKLKNSMKDAFVEFRKDLLNYEPSLDGIAGQSLGKIDFVLKTLENKVFSSHKKKSQDIRERLYRLEKAVFPRRGLQERAMNITYFIARYGFGIIPFFYEKIDSERKEHQIITLSEFV